MSIVHSAARRIYEDAARDPETTGRGRPQLPWFRKWDRVFEWDFPTFRWFSGAETSLAHNCLDGQVETGRGSHTALVYLERASAGGILPPALDCFQVSMPPPTRLKGRSTLEWKGENERAD